MCAKILPDDVATRAVARRKGMEIVGRLGDTSGPHADAGSQTAATLANLGLVLEAAGGTLADVVSHRIHVAAAAAGDLTPIGRGLPPSFGQGQPPAATWLVVSGLADAGLLVEIEAHAVVS